MTTDIIGKSRGIKARYPDRKERDLKSDYPIPQINTKIHYWFAENEQKARKTDIKYMKEFFPDTVFGKYPDLGHAGLVLLKPELFAEKIGRL